ncbi:hypothetical protein ACM7TW_08425, partial [Pseudomonas aeruginosa]
QVSAALGGQGRIGRIGTENVPSGDEFLRRKWDDCVRPFFGRAHDHALIFQEMILSQGCNSFAPLGISGGFRRSPVPHLPECDLCAPKIVSATENEARAVTGFRGIILESNAERKSA